MAMTGRIEGNAIIPDRPLPLPDGTRVVLELSEDVSGTRAVTATPLTIRIYLDNGAPWEEERLQDWFALADVVQQEREADLTR